MTKSETVELAQRLIPLLYARPSQADTDFVQSLHDGMMRGPSYDAFLASLDEGPTYAECFADHFLNNLITE